MNQLSSDENITATLAHLAKALKTPTIGRVWQQLGDTARDQGWSHEQYLAAVLQRQVADREGGFNWSSQHLDHGGVWWDARRRSIQRSQQTRGGSGQLIERCVPRCDLLGGLNRLERCSVNFGG